MEREDTDNYQPFVYPKQRHERRHGPRGYTEYHSYRDWLRDEFIFRCVFCLKREQWDVMDGNWDIDHFVPQAIHPEGEVDYDNLLYVCHSCNVVKSDQVILNPCEVALGDCLIVQQNGNIDHLNEDGEYLIEMLRLNSKNRNEWRRRMIATFDALRDKTEILDMWFCYPDDLPDLSSKRPKGGNSRPEGVNNSYYALRALDLLPKTY